MAKRPSMDSIKTPDLKNLDKEQSEKLSSHDLHPNLDDGRVHREFMPVSPKSGDFDVKPKDESLTDRGERDYEQFETKSIRDAKKNKASGHFDQGVLVHGSYIARKRLIRIITIIAMALILWLLFAPPIFSANDNESGCRYEDIFANKGSSQYKTEILGKGYVYNIGALSSDQSESYRICTVAFDVNNYLPLPVDVKDYAVSFGGDFKDNIVYAYADNDAKHIPSMTKKTIHVNILINRSGLSDGEFDRAITSLMLTTKGMKKFGVLPCIPAVMSVSDYLTFDPDVK